MLILCSASFVFYGKETFPNIVVNFRMPGLNSLASKCGGRSKIDRHFAPPLPPDHILTSIMCGDLVTNYCLQLFAPSDGSSRTVVSYRHRYCPHYLFHLGRHDLREKRVGISNVRCGVILSF